MKPNTTNQLLNILNQTDKKTTLDKYIDTLTQTSPYHTFADYYFSLNKVKALGNPELIRRTGIERSYYYQLANGRRRPGRDKIIALAIAANLDLTETQRALKISQQAILYARTPRDAIFIFAIKQNMSISETIELLTSYGEMSFDYLNI